MRYTKSSMINTILRIIWRLLIFALGSAVAWFMVFHAYPYADTRLPAFVALLLFYCLFVYLIFPTLMRLFRIVIKPDHIPLYATTGDGWPSDPINLAILANNKTHLRRAMKKAGWYEADKLNVRNGFREVMSILFNLPYPAAPVSGLYLFNRRHDIAFQIPTNSKLSARTRHHVRFWRLEEPRPKLGNHHHYGFWKTQLEKFVGVKRSIWIGAATEDHLPVDLQWRTGKLTHGGSHDANAERDFIIATLKGTGVVKRVSTTRSGDELKFRGQQFRTIYITDGSLKVIELLQPSQKTN